MFLCVVDDSAELRPALRFACRRARETGGRVALLYAIEPPEFQDWVAVGKLIAEEQRDEAEAALHALSEEVQQLSGEEPIVFIRQGRITDALMSLIETEKDLSILVLGAATTQSGPGPVISFVMKRVGRLPLPVAIVPGSLTDAQIDAVT